jgi:hypothetical protein
LTARLQIEQVNRIELCNDLVGPVFEHPFQRYIIRNGEGQIEIRPAITTVKCQRADNCSRDDACVRGRLAGRNPVVNALTVCDTEHLGIKYHCFTKSSRTRRRVPKRRSVATCENREQGGNHARSIQQTTRGLKGSVGLVR